MTGLERCGKVAASAMQLYVCFIVQNSRQIMSIGCLCIVNQCFSTYGGGYFCGKNAGEYLYSTNNYLIFVT